MPFRILFASDSQAVRNGIERACADRGIAIDRFVKDHAELQRALVEEHFDILVCEHRLRKVEMLELLGDLRKEMRDLKIIMFTHVANPTLAAQCVSNQLYDFVLQCGNANKLVSVLESIENGTPNPNSVLDRFRAFMATEDWPIPQMAELLTKREFQVVVHLALGLSNREIMGSLDVSLETVKEHVQNLIRKLKVNDRTAAAVWSLRNKMPTITFSPEDLN